MAVKAKATISLVRVDDGETGKGVLKTEVYYYLSTSNTTQTGGEWVTTPPAWIDGRYYWQKIKTTFTDNTTSESKPVCITGGKGSSGSDGKSVSSITTQFYLSTSKTTQTGGSWVDTMPTWSVGKYLWTRSKIVYINPLSTVYTAPVCDSSWDAINDIEIGGRNLLIGTANYTGDVAYTSNSAIPIDDEVKYNDLLSIRTYKPWQGAYLDLSKVLNRHGAKIGDVYTIQIMFMVNFDDLGDIRLHLYRAVDETTAGVPRATITAEPNKWYKASFTFTVDDYSLSDDSPNTTRIEIDNFDSSLVDEEGNKKMEFGEGKYAWFAGYKLEKGNMATDWTPAPEDTGEVNIGGRNFVVGTSDSWSEWIILGEGSNANHVASEVDLARMGLKADDEITMQVEIEGDGFTQNTVFIAQGSVNGVWSGSNWFTNPWSGNLVNIGGRLEKINNPNRYTATYKMPQSSIDVINSAGGICKLGFRLDGCNAEAKYRYRCIKIEKGNKATDWTPAPEDTQSAIDDALDQATSEITTQYTSLINETAKQLELMVTQLKTITDGHTTSISSISNQLQITSEMAQFVKTTTEKLQDAVDGKLSATEVQEWARFDGANLELGASNSPFKCKLSTTELAFYQGANKVAWISNNELNILTAIITKSIGVGNFTWVDEGDLGLSLM